MWPNYIIELMKKALSIFVVGLILPLLWSCGGDDESRTETTEPATIDFLLSKGQWQLYDGFTQVETDSYSFMRIAGNLVGAHVSWKDKDYKNRITNRYSFGFTPPIAILTYEDGKKEELTIYRIMPSESDASISESFISINGRKYIGLLNGIDM